MPIIDTKKVEILTQLAEDNSSLVIFMRHGVQINDRENKIHMMQLPQNQTDGVTNASLRKTKAIAHAISHITDETQKRLLLYSSKTMRAVEIAQVVSTITKSPIIFDENLSSVNYRKDLSDKEIEKILENNQGLLPWNEKIVDTVCESGKGTYKNISQHVAIILEKYFLPNTITFIITHTQQINAASILARLQPFRLPQLGMIVFSKNHYTVSAVQFPHAIFAD